jgi:dipeptidyl-peptidase-4
LVIVDDRDGVKRLIVDGKAVTPLTLNVRSVVSVANEAVVFMANEIAQPEALSAWRWTSDSLTPLTPLDGMHSISLGGPTSVVRRASTSLTRATTTVTTTLHGSPSTHNIASFSEEALVRPNVQFIRAGKRQIPCALILPRDIKPGTKLPVLMDPYGGPHAQRVVDSYTAHCTSQWFADQGFAVLVVDGRGTPGLGTEWERSVYLDLATVVIEDQVDALHAVAADHPELDLDRVAIRGWSFGGYLAALAVLRRPDVFHSAVAGAPVTEWRLYDTFYTERYLGNPAIDAAPYETTSLINEAHKLSRPLLLVHGLADDNVVAAHTLQFSSALLAAGKPHEVLPLSGVTHMTPQAVVAENLLLHQLDFLRRTL